MRASIVIITSIVVAATAAAVSSRFDSFSTVGGIIGSSVSAAFLILLGLMNGYILFKLIKQMQKVFSLAEGQEDEAWKIEGGGILFSILKKMFKLIDRYVLGQHNLPTTSGTDHKTSPWKMYPLGILFGLGFDTSSEIALLGISSVEAAKGTSFWVILILPALFTGLSCLRERRHTSTDHILAGMCLLDTIDGALMFSLYIQPAANFLPPKRDSTASDEAPSIDGDDLPQSQGNHRDPVAFLYYSIVLTILTVIVAIVIGVIQLLTLILNVTNAKGKFWDGVQVAGDYYDAIGGGICGCFIIFGGLSVLLYKPWRRWMDRRHGRQPVVTFEGDHEGPRSEGFDDDTGIFGHEERDTIEGGKRTSSKIAVTARETDERRIEDEIV